MRLAGSFFSNCMAAVFNCHAPRAGMVLTVGCCRFMINQTASLHFLLQVVVRLLAICCRRLRLHLPGDQQVETNRRAVAEASDD